MGAKTQTDPNVESVRSQLRDRARVGLLKYGVDTTRIDMQALIAAAQEIDRKAELSDQRARRFGELAQAARSVTTGGPEHRAIIEESRQLSTTVVDFGDAINALRAALRK